MCGENRLHKNIHILHIPTIMGKKESHIQRKTSNRETCNVKIVKDIKKKIQEIKYIQEASMMREVTGY